MKLQELFRKHSIVGVCGCRGSAKTTTALIKLKQLRNDYPKLNIAVMGINHELHDQLDKLNIRIIKSKMDILDLRMRDTVIFIDEIALFFSSRNKNKEQDKLMRWFDRIEHLNCKLLLSTAREGYFNKFMCSRVNAFIVKQTDYDALVNGTWLKERVQAIESTSDYRLECPKDKFYLVTNTGELTTDHTVKYDASLDSKKNNNDLFADAVPTMKRSKVVFE